MLTEVCDRLDQIDPQREVLRLNLVFCLFCKTDPKAMIDPGLWLLDLWEQEAGSALTWVMVGSSASSLSKTNKGTHAKIQKEIRASSTKKIDFFRFQGPQAYGPDYRLFWSAVQDSKENHYKRSNLVELMLPLPESEEGWSRYERVFQEISEQFPYDTGYAAPSLVFCKETEKVKAGEFIGPIARRHKGLDVANNASTTYNIDRMTRGARWITYLSKSNAELLDDALIQARPKQVGVTETANGLIIRSDDQPEIGDTNRKQDVPGLRHVAELLRPITFFGDKHLRMLFRKDADLVDSWEKRFFDE